MRGFFGGGSSGPAPTSTPTPTVTPTSTATPTAASAAPATPTPIPTSTPTLTPTPSPTSTPSPTPTSTPSMTPTPSPTPYTLPPGLGRTTHSLFGDYNAFRSSAGGHAYNLATHPGLDVVSSRHPTDNFALIGTAVHAVYDGYIFAEGGDFPYRAYLRVGATDAESARVAEYEVLYSHIAVAKTGVVKPGDVIGYIIDISLDDPKYVDPPYFNHLHVEVRTNELKAENRVHYDPQYLLDPQ